MDQVIVQKPTPFQIKQFYSFKFQRMHMICSFVAGMYYYWLDSQL